MDQSALVLGKIELEEAENFVALGFQADCVFTLLNCAVKRLLVGLLSPQDRPLERLRVALRYQLLLVDQDDLVLH